MFFFSSHMKVVISPLAPCCTLTGDFSYVVWLDSGVCGFTQTVMWVTSSTLSQSVSFAVCCQWDTNCTFITVTGNVETLSDQAQKLQKHLQEHLCVQSVVIKHLLHYSYNLSPMMGRSVQYLITLFVTKKQLLSFQVKGYVKPLLSTYTQ